MFLERLLPWLGPIVILALWVIVTETGLVQPLFLPGPRDVAQAASDLGGSLMLHTLATSARVVAGLIMGTCLGFFAGVLMAHSRLVYLMLNGIVESWRPVPPVALIPFFLLWFGFSNFGKILLVVLGVALVVLVNAFEAARSVPDTLLRAAYSLGASRHSVFRDVLLPAAAAGAVGGVRVASALAVGLVVVSEFMGAQYGLGYLINVSKVTFRTPTILLGVVILGVLSWILDWIIRSGARRWLPWSRNL